MLPRARRPHHAGGVKKSSGMKHALVEDVEEQNFEEVSSAARPQYHGIESTANAFFSLFRYPKSIAADRVCRLGIIRRLFFGVAHSRTSQKPKSTLRLDTLHLLRNRVYVVVIYFYVIYLCCAAYVFWWGALCRAAIIGVRLQFIRLVIVRINLIISLLNTYRFCRLFRNLVR